MTEPKWRVSQMFHGGGIWHVHLPGPNRPRKHSFDTEAEAREYADYLNAGNKCNGSGADFFFFDTHVQIPGRCRVCEPLEEWELHSK